MTAPLRNVMRCKKCGEELACPHCGERVTVSTPFSDWLRALPFPLNAAFVSNQNLDYIWHHYRAGWFITIEEKRYGGACSFAQQDTHGIATQMLAHGSGQLVRTARGIERVVEYRGHYVIVFEKTTPDDSAWIHCNGMPIDAAGLLQLLSTGTRAKGRAPFDAQP